MVQIIQTPRSRSWGEEIGDAINQGASAGINAYLSRKNRQEELAEQYKYASLRDKDIERREIAKEQRGSQKNLLLAHQLAKMDGNEEMFPVYFSIADSAGAAEAVKSQREMDPTSKSRMLEDLTDFADDKENGFSPAYKQELKQKKEQEQPGKTEQIEEMPSLTHTNQYSQFNQNQQAPQNAQEQPQEQASPQIVFDNRLTESTQPRANEVASSGIAGQQPAPQPELQNQLGGYDKHYIGQDKKTGEKKYEYSPKTLSQCKNLDEARSFAKWNASTPTGRDKIVDQWEREQGRLKELRGEERAINKSKEDMELAIDKDFIIEAKDATIHASAAKDALQALATIRKRGNIGPLTWPTEAVSPTTRYDKSAYDQNAIKLLHIYKQMLPKMTNDEFNRLQKDYLPKSNDTSASNNAKEDALMQMVDHAAEIGNLVDSLQNPDGSYPKNIAGKVMHILQNKGKTVRVVDKNGVKGSIPFENAEEAINSGEYKRI